MRRALFASRGLCRAMCVVGLLALLLPASPFASSSGGGSSDGGGGGPDALPVEREERITLADLRELYHRDLVQATELCQALLTVRQPAWPHPEDAPMLNTLLQEQHIDCPPASAPARP